MLCDVAVAEADLLHALQNVPTSQTTNNNNNDITNGLHKKKKTNWNEAKCMGQNMMK